MNTYYKFYPNVFVAKCTEPHEKGEIIQVTTRYCKENDCIVFNLVGKKDGFFYYSIVRADGMNSQEFAKKRAERLVNASVRSEQKSDQFWQASYEGREFLALGEPIKIGHHSEKRHRALIERNFNRMAKSVEFSQVSEDQLSRSEYWADRANKIDLSMPESIDFFEFKLEEAKARHEGLKNGTIEREHSFSLTYAKKEVNEIEKKVKIAKLLWA